MIRKTYVAGAAFAILSASAAGSMGACGGDGNNLLGENTYGGGGNDASASGANGQKDGGGSGMGSPSIGDDGGTMTAPTVPFEPVPPSVYVAKVKNLLTGLAVTDAEVAQVVAGADDAGKQAALRTLIQGWMQLPQFQGKMIGFFRNAFQQNQVNEGTLQTNVGGPYGANIGPSTSKFVQNVQDSFALTAWDTVTNKRPFNGTFTTTTFMMTTAMKSYLAYLDEIAVDDNGKSTNRLVARNQLPTGFVLDPKGTNVLADILNPSNTTTYMHWPWPFNEGACPAGTTFTPLAIGATKGAAANDYATLFNFLFGESTVSYPDAGNACKTAFTSETPVFSDSDWSDWTPVTVTQISGATPTSPVFYDILSLRSATTMQLHTPRIGYGNTLAFEANWGTNVTNEHRVTANQTLIVGVGKSIDGEDDLVLFPVNATDGDHASNPACAGCHAQLDPIKQYVRQSYTLFDHEQLDAGTIAQPAGFSFDGVTVNTGSGEATLMNTLATHPHMGPRWAEKLVFWANSTPAEEVMSGTFDPEITRIANAFTGDNYNFYTLVQEVFSSPLVTFATPTQTTTDLGVLNSIARRDHYCAALSNRLGLTDICGQNVIKTSNVQNQVAASATLMASDGYYRAYALPSLPTDPDLFFRSTVEAMCTTIATEVVDVKSQPDAGPLTSKNYLSSDPTGSIADLVATIMNIPPSDPRSAPLQQILMEHFTNAQLPIDGGSPDGGTLAGAGKTQAMVSTFILACTSPTATLMGL